MTQREEVISQINLMFDRTEASGRVPIGFAAALVHAGHDEELGHSTVETRTLVSHGQRMATPLAGGVEILRTRVLENVVYKSEAEAEPETEATP